MTPDDDGTGTARADRRQAQAAAFDQIGERYDEAFPHKEGQVAAVSWLTGQLEPGARILDAGCGTGLPTASQLTEALMLRRSQIPAALARFWDILVRSR